MIILKYKGFINEQLNNKFYHFSESVLKPGEILKSKICDEQTPLFDLYINKVMPVYRDVAKNHGFEWPVFHGYCYTTPEYIQPMNNVESYKETVLKNTMCYEVIADADIHIGAIDKSAMLATMSLEHNSISESLIEVWAKQYFMSPPTSYKEAICGRFKVVCAIERSEWSVGRPS